MILTPVHQFEIRFTTLLNFSRTVKPIVAPFVKLATRLILDDENLISEKITLMFDDEYYQIIILSDRIIFRCDKYDVSGLTKNNSFLEEPFFNIFNKIQDLQDFGIINNVLFWSFYVNTDPSRTLVQIKKDFISENFADKSCANMISELTDIAITLESKEQDGSQLSVTTGPYLGIEDLDKRGFKIKDEKLLKELDTPGEIIEYKHFMVTAKTNFASYKELSKKAEGIITKRWDSR